MGKKKTKQFIDEYCELVLKHKLQFGFEFTDETTIGSSRIVFADVVVEEFSGTFIVGATYPNKELAQACLFLADTKAGE